MGQNLETLDRLVLGDAARAVDAAHGRGVPTPFLVAAAVPPLLRHLHSQSADEGTLLTRECNEK